MPAVSSARQGAAAGAGAGSRTRSAATAPAATAKVPASSSTTGPGPAQASSPAPSSGLITRSPIWAICSTELASPSRSDGSITASSAVWAEVIRLFSAP